MRGISCKSCQYMTSLFWSDKFTSFVQVNELLMIILHGFFACSLSIVLCNVSKTRENIYALLLYSLLPSARSTPCISVSTTPGRIAMLVISGSSTASVEAKWFIAALELKKPFSLLDHNIYI